MKIVKFLMISILILVLLVTAAGCSSSGGSNASTSANKNEIMMKDFLFQPAEITINKGETVTWINRDSAIHDVSGNAFKSDSLKKNQSFSQTFNETGTFDYVCKQHTGMTGKVIVK